MAVRSVEARLHELLGQTRDLQARALGRLRDVEQALGEVAARIDALSREPVRNGAVQAQRDLDQAVLREKHEALRAQRAAIGERLSQLHLGAKKITSAIAQSQLSADYLAGGFGDGDDERLNLNQIWMLEAQEEERRRLAREIHDGPAQVLANATFQLEYVSRLLDREPVKVRSELERLRADLREGLVEVRHFIFDLRPRPLAELGLGATVQRYVDGFQQRANVVVDLDVDYESERLSPTKEIAVFRIVQEALQNVCKHGRASQVHVSLKGGPDGMVVRIEDNGVGFDPSARAEAGGRHFGLSSMEERARLIGAELRIASVPGNGTTIELTVPPEGAAQKA